MRDCARYVTIFSIPKRGKNVNKEMSVVRGSRSVSKGTTRPSVTSSITKDMSMLAAGVACRAAHFVEFLRWYSRVGQLQYMRVSAPSFRWYRTVDSGVEGPLCHRRCYKKSK